MAVVHYELANGTLIRADGGRARESVMTLARRAGVPGIVGECGGYAACATCHVHIAPEWRAIVGPPAPGSEEDAVLDMVGDRGPDSRLGCQLWLDEPLDGLRVRVGAP